MQYPIEITEHPHQGKPQTWTLWDNAHLVRCIDATRGKFDEWAESDGGAAVYNAENYLNFLCRDLKKIEVKEVE